MKLIVDSRRIFSVSEFAKTHTVTVLILKKESFSAFFVSYWFLSSLLSSRSPVSISLPTISFFVSLVSFSFLLNNNYMYSFITGRTAFVKEKANHVKTKSGINTQTCGKQMKEGEQKIYQNRVCDSRSETIPVTASDTGEGERTTAEAETEDVELAALLSAIEEFEEKEEEKGMYSASSSSESSSWLLARLGKREESVISLS